MGGPGPESITHLNKLHANQPALELPAPGGVRPGVAVIEGKRCQLLLDVVAGSWRRLGFDAIDDEAFFQLVLARLVEPTSKVDSLRVLAELGVEPVHLSTVKRCLKRCAVKDYRDRIAEACFTHVWSEHGGDVSLLMYDVTTLLCRRRHNSVYADPSVMPMSGVFDGSS